MRRALALAAVLLASASGAWAVGGDLSRTIGKALFERAWVSAPSSTLANDGLGPLFNARACAYCHQGLDRAISEVGGDGSFTQPGMILKLSDGEGRADAAYGAQLQTAAVSGVSPEGRLVMTPHGAEARDLAFGAFAPGTHAGVRAAPSLRGVGRIADIPDAAILAHVDPDDRDGDGVSGRANMIADSKGGQALGRFGLKSSGVTLTEQIETAFSLDLGMSTPGRTALAGDCVQDVCRAAPHGGTEDAPEIRHDLVAMLADYLASVPPPPAAGGDAEGTRLFASTGCASCHTPSLPDSSGGAVAAFSDLLLHDLGPGLDGGATEPGVLRTEWRTAPLWGISRALATRAGLLHDGRAKDVVAAVDLHGGEGEGARARFTALPEGERTALLRYVEGL